MGLSDIFSAIFKRPNPNQRPPFQPTQPPMGNDSAGPSGSLVNSPEAIANNQAAAGFYPKQGDNPPTGNIDGKGPQPQPSFPTAAAPTGTATATAPDSYVDPAQAYEQNGGVPYDTPKFYPDAKGVKPATAQQAAFEERYKNETPEQRQQDLIQGKAPVDHNVFTRILKGAARGFAKGGLGGAIVGGTAQGFWPSQNREANAAEELPKVTAGIEATNRNTATRQQEDYRKAQTQNIYDDNTRQADALKEKTDLDKSRVAYWNRKADQGDLKQATNEDLLKLRDKWMTSKDKNDQKRLGILEKELGERTRHDQATENIAKTNEIGRNTRQQTGIAAKADLESLKTKAKAAFEQMKQAQGEQKAIRTVNQKFVDAYTRKNGHAPTPDEINNNFAQIYGDDQQ
jgi:hypothetical protein